MLGACTERLATPPGGAAQAAQRVAFPASSGRRRRLPMAPHALSAPPPSEATAKAIVWGTELRWGVLAQTTNCAFSEALPMRADAHSGGRRQRSRRCVKNPYLGYGGSSKRSGCPAGTTGFGRVGMWRGGGRIGLSVSSPFVWRCLTSRAMTPFPHPPGRRRRSPASGSHRT